MSRAPFTPYCTDTEGWGFPTRKARMTKHIIIHLEKKSYHAPTGTPGLLSHAEATPLFQLQDYN